MRSVVEIGASVPAFLGKLWKLVNDTETNHLISWSPGGKTFVIKNQADFARELLPLYYKHNNMASFIRQLNMYGFHKITSVENGGLRYEKDEIEFSHHCFMRGHAYLLEHIKRKIANPKSIVTSGESGEKILLKPELMNKVLADVKQMKGKQETLDAKFSAMKQENEALWREVAILRQKHIKQQQIVNNLIQFLMSLVQPARPPPPGGNNVGVKRPYQLMINSAAHNTLDGYPNKAKNIKLDKDGLLEELNEENNLEDGPTIHELVHDDICHNDASQDPLDAANYVSIDVPGITTYPSPTDPSALQYQVTMEDGDDVETDGAASIRFYPANRTNGNTLNTTETLPVVNSPVADPTSPGQVVNNVMASPGTSKPKARVNGHKNARSMMNSANFNSMNPSADLKLPAEIFASDDSVSDAGLATAEDIAVQNLQDTLLSGDICKPSKDKMLGTGLNIKIEKPAATSKSSKKSKKEAKNNENMNLNLADIKTELQDDLDWNNMTLATINNNTNVNRYQSRNDIDDHLDSMQTDLESLRELLRSDSYAFDTNTLMGVESSSNCQNMLAGPSDINSVNKLFGSDDPFYGLSYNTMDDRTKAANGAKKQKGEITDLNGEDEHVEVQCTDDDVEGNQLISYTGNIPDFEYINMPDLEGDNTEDACMSPSPASTTLNTPQVEVPSPMSRRS
ncbi:heat shock factor protein isoform X3 [Ostrinia furnacalis]|uniref:heat shock factor protein isoform X3 n=1 Tax=Ostrinia furnacalis TaxID=93504 RepID=UPI00103E9E6E|nr:heat shock factor protein isoform X3 [Ostrinia furnacalis]